MGQRGRLATGGQRVWADAGFTLREGLLFLHPHGRAGTGNLQTPAGCGCPDSGHRHAGRCGVGNVPLYLGRGGIWSCKG